MIRWDSVVNVDSLFWIWMFTIFLRIVVLVSIEANEKQVYRSSHIVWFDLIVFSDFWIWMFTIFVIDYWIVWFMITILIFCLGCIFKQGCICCNRRLMESGLLPMEVARKGYDKKQKRNKFISPVKAVSVTKKGTIICSIFNQNEDNSLQGIPWIFHDLMKLWIAIPES